MIVGARLPMALLISVIVIGVCGWVGFAQGSPSGASDEAVTKAHDQAQRKARKQAAREAERDSAERSYRKGRRQGKIEGRSDGKAAAEDAQRTATAKAERARLEKAAKEAAETPSKPDSTTGPTTISPEARKRLQDRPRTPTTPGTGGGVNSPTEIGKQAPGKKP